MVVDTSALFAMLSDEPDSGVFEELTGRRVQTATGTRLPARRSASGAERRRIMWTSMSIDDPAAKKHHSDVNDWK